ncbi:ribbon-helix-helix protein, CopG family [Nocardia huaxiensis]|uniref:Ribbon-helix-helix protein, CopG family n=1 Tax=Nocardia huaxiensis TaxID=2755382 RepID=A0A7D6V9C0_9NOCA|nr:ribbon-helix-helix protein, CopG family [Nocardia huaxiensis]QLY29914.1 ribbon-helix-helix protein, CopG family [Nocardia huaxiensis]
MNDRPGEDYPRNAAEAEEFLKDLTFDDDAPVGELPGPDAPVTVLRSVRLPFEMDQRIREEAEHRGISMSDLIRDFLAIELAALDDDAPISRADARRALTAALANLHPLHQRPA